MTSILLRGARVIDPAAGRDGVDDVRVVDGRIAEFGKKLTLGDAREIDLKGCILAPGFVDVHVHLREPGGEHKETIETGSRSAVAGGFTSICAMPNTSPAIDDPAAVGFVVAEGRRVNLARVYPVGAITQGLKGEQLAPIGEMVAAGAVAITDDGRPVMDSAIMRMALDYTRAFDIPVASHCEDLMLSRGGAMNEGGVSTRLGLQGIPNAAEDVMISRDLMLAELTGGHIHLQHVSTRLGVAMIRAARLRGVRVTAEGTPHHFTLTDQAIERYATNAKMNPPLRAAADREAVREGVRDGTLDIIATDHAPHHYDEKEREFDDAPNGIVGLETALGLAWTELVETSLLTPSALIERMSTTPARAFHLPGGRIEVGDIADITVFDPRMEWRVDPALFFSRSRNTPFTGRTLRARAVLTVVGGRIVFENGQVVG